MSEISYFRKYDTNSIVDRLKELRKREHITQQDLANKLSVNRTLVVAWENPKHKAFPSLDQMLQLCNIYGCELSYLLCEQECTVKDIQAIQDYTGLSEPSIRLLHDLKKNNRRPQLAAVNSILSDSGCNVLDYWAIAMGAQVSIKTDLAKMPELLDSDDIERISDYEAKLVSHQNHLSFIKDKAMEAFERLMEESSQLGKTEGVLNKKIQELVSVLMRTNGMTRREDQHGEHN